MASKAKIKQLDITGAGEGSVPVVTGGQLVWSSTSTGVVQLPTNTGTLATGTSGAIRYNATTDSLQLFSQVENAWVDVSSSASSNTLDPNIDYNAGHPAITDFLGGTTTYSQAVNELNQTMGLLIPTAPPSFSALAINPTTGGLTRGGINILLASGVTNNTTETGPVSAGSNIWRVTTTASNSIVINPSNSNGTGFGSATDGTLSAFVNGTLSGSKALTTSSDVGLFTNLQILTDSTYGTTGFWNSLSAQITNASTPVGQNSFRLNETSPSANTATSFFVVDDLTSLPVTSNIQITEGLNPSTVFSSSIPHYASSSTLIVSAAVTNLCGRSYLATNLMEIISNPSFGNQVTINPGTNGVAAIPTQNTLTFSLSNVSYVISSNTFESGVIQVRGRNPQGDGSFANSATQVLILGEVPLTASSPVGFSTIPYTDTTGSTLLANTQRIGIAVNSDTPSFTPVGGWAAFTPNWSNTQSILNYDATIVAGAIKNDQTNYSTGFLPVGPNLSSGRNNTQYVTFALFGQVVSQFDIDITGTYTGCWIQLPEITGLNNTLNGWWTMSSLYDGAGVPDSGGNGPGCALGSVMTGASGVFRATFGTQSSANSTQNLILVRFSLTASQSITGLRFKRTT